MLGNVEDVGPTLYKCYTNVLCLLGLRKYSLSKDVLFMLLFPASSGSSKSSPRGAPTTTSTPSANIKATKSKIGSLDKAAHTPGGGNVGIPTRHKCIIIILFVHVTMGHNQFNMCIFYYVCSRIMVFTGAALSMLRLFCYNLK